MNSFHRSHNFIYKVKAAMYIEKQTPGDDGNKTACAKVRTAEEVATKIP